MAVTPSPNPARPIRRPSLLWSRLHFLARLAGLTGLLVGAAGVALLTPGQRQDPAAALSVPEGQAALAGFAVALAALLIEAVAALQVVAGRRSAFGAVAVVQVLLAAVLLVGVNVWSYQHPARIDCTRDRLFTLPVDVREQLARLDPRRETTIVLYQRHTSSASAGAKPDQLDLEAERKVVEKVKDLVELFREVGPQFRVEVLDVGSRDYTEKLAGLTSDSPELKKAIEEAPESSILVRSGPHVQRMSFSEFYRLDRTASHDPEHPGQVANLVLRSVGPGPLTRRIVGVEERPPRVGVLAAHEALTTEGPFPTYTFSGAARALRAAGFEVRDVLLRRLNGDVAADSLEVTKLERLREELDDLDSDLRSVDREIALLRKLTALLGKKGEPDDFFEQVNRLIGEYAEQFNRAFLLVRATRANREQVTRVFGNLLSAARENRELAREQRREVEKDLGGLDADRITEQRRLRDLEAKLARALADVDLLLIPRLTLLQSGEPIVDPRFYDLDRRQARAVRAFLRRGKPVFACLGPTNMPAGSSRPGGSRAIKPPDELEQMLAELGVVFGKRTVLYNTEKRGFAGRDDSAFRVSKPLQVPPLRVEPAARTTAEELAQTAYTEVREPLAALGTAPAGVLFAAPFLRADAPPLAENPVRASLRLADEESGRRLDLRPRFLRPVFIDPLKMRTLTYQPDVLATEAASWNDEQPFSTVLRPVPRFEPPAPDDPDNGTLEARRRGPFAVGVAVETRLPPGWESDGRKVRLAAVGQAGLFTGTELAAGQRRLLVDTCNWLLGRDERLAGPAPEWSYPRLALDEAVRDRWLLGARLGLPVLFAYLGLVVLLFRRLR